MSADATLDSGDRLLATVNHSGGLDPGQGYESSASVSLPIGVSGDFFFFVQTDVFGEVFEHAFENNNTGFDDPATRVNLTPPPDLEVTSVDAPAMALASRALTINTG